MNNQYSHIAQIKSCKKNAGMTLLEILMYMALFSFCFMTLGQVALGAQKVAQKISTNKEHLMIDMYMYKFAQHKAYGQGDFIDEESIKDFLTIILIKKDFPIDKANMIVNSAEVEIVPIGQAVQQSVGQNDSDLVQKFQSIKYQIGNSQRSLRIYLL